MKLCFAPLTDKNDLTSKFAIFSIFSKSTSITVNMGSLIMQSYYYYKQSHKIVKKNNYSVHERNMQFTISSYCHPGLHAK